MRWDGFCGLASAKRKKGRHWQRATSNLFTVVPLLESLQTSTPVLVVGTNIASSLAGKTGGALHETPQQIDIIRPLTRFARRVAGPDEIPEAFAAAAAILRSPAPGPVFIEIPHDFFAAPVPVKA